MNRTVKISAALNEAIKILLKVAKLIDRRHLACRFQSEAFDFLSLEQTNFSRDLSDIRRFGRGGVFRKPVG